MKRFLLMSLLAACGLISSPVQAQFPSTPTQTFYVCNAPGEQKYVQAFGDGAGGSVVYWVDKRGDRATGTAIYGQRLTAAGAIQGPANGKLLFQAHRSEIWGMKAVPWRGGALLAWVQGPYGVGGDTVRCQFYNAAGVAQWSRPTVLAARDFSTSVIYEVENGLNVLPNDSGATITFGLVLSGGSDQLTFNRVNNAGVRRWPSNYFQIPVPFSIYYQTISDGGNGFYVTGGTGGLGSALYVQHYSLQGTPWAAGLNLSATGADGRGNSAWRMVRDVASNLYVVWGSNSGDVYVTKITPQGALGWAAPGYRLACTNVSRQEIPHAIWHNSALWVIWNDNRTPASNYYQYAQRLDAAGTLAWNAGGILVNNLPSFYTDPKLIPASNGSVIAFYNTSQPNGFRAQKLLPAGAVGWVANGAPINTTPNDAPNYQDFEPVANPDGSASVFWATGLGDICGAKVSSSGALAPLGLTEAAKADDFTLWPNPATETVQLQAAGRTSAAVQVFDACGRTVYAAPSEAEPIRVAGWPAGVYVVRATWPDGRALTRRLVVGGAR